MAAFRVRKEKVLVLDPDAPSREILLPHLQRAGYQVVETTSGGEALSEAAVERPDLIIMESVLPDLDGLEVCRRLQTGVATRQIPVMFLTVKDESEDRLAALSAGAYDYVTKPFSPAEIMSRIEAHFRRSRKDRESNPLTGLPGGPQVSPELNARIAQGQPFALLYADLDSFTAFNDYYGFIR